MFIRSLLQAGVPEGTPEVEVQVWRSRSSTGYALDLVPAYTHIDVEQYNSLNVQCEFMNLFCDGEAWLLCCMVVLAAQSQVAVHPSSGVISVAFTDVRSKKPIIADSAKLASYSLSQQGPLTLLL